MNRNTLKEHIGQGRLIRIVGAHNGLTAKLVEEAGFEGVWASGLEISTSHAVPDANILTMTDFLNASSEMAHAVSIPVIADCDTGFGNSNNVMHMVKRFEAAGVNAVCIEDKKFPKVNSFISGRQDLAPIAEFVGKIMAAKNAGNTDAFMVFARVEALIAGWGHGEALKRAHAYVDAGADAIFIHSKSDRPDEIIEFCRDWDKKAPLLICPTTFHIDEADMEALGINIVIYANHGLRAAIKSMQSVLNRIEKHGKSGIDDKIVSMDEVFRLQGMYAMKHNEKKFLKTGLGSVKAIIPAAGYKVDDSLRSLVEDRPVGMLDINGKSLLQRNIETLNIAGVQDVSVVAGYQAARVIIDGAGVVDNREFKTTGIMYSVMQGVDEIADKNLILYSDIIIDCCLLENLLKKEADIILVGDRSYKKTSYRNKKLELIVTDNPFQDGHRTIDTNRKNIVKKIGDDISEQEGDCEFVGLALLSKKGMRLLVDEYKASNLGETISFADFIQCLVEKNHEVLVYEVTGGWMEIHTFEDYKNACAVFS
ncbi:MAG: phosphoenolpyruvate mutase [Deltaproteobacteria bacterium]|nr:phosphoenolpyruvate mutase [Deltaproteobacteria bacterium]